MTAIWTLPHECKDGLWPCNKNCECQRMDFATNPEKWIALHCKAMQKSNGGNLQERVVNFIRRYSDRAKLPDLDFGRFPAQAKSPELEKVLRKIKAA